MATGQVRFRFGLTQTWPNWHLHRHIPDLTHDGLYGPWNQPHSMKVTAGSGLLVVEFFMLKYENKIICFEPTTCRTSLLRPVKIWNFGTPKKRIIYKVKTNTAEKGMSGTAKTQTHPEPNSSKSLESHAQPDPDHHTSNPSLIRVGRAAPHLDRTIAIPTKNFIVGLRRYP